MLSIGKIAAAPAAARYYTDLIASPTRMPVQKGTRSSSASCASMRASSSSRGAPAVIALHRHPGERLHFMDLVVVERRGRRLRSLVGTEDWVSRQVVRTYHRGRRSHRSAILTANAASRPWPRGR